MSSAGDAELAGLDLLHQAAALSLDALEWLHSLCLRFELLPAGQRGPVSIYDGFLVPVAHVKELLAGKRDATVAMLRRMTATRLKLGALHISLGTVPSASAHELALYGSRFIIRIWNQIARPDLPDYSPHPLAEDWDIDIYPPRPDMDRTKAAAFMAMVHTWFKGFNPRHLDAQLKLEYAQAAETIRAKPDKTPAAGSVQIAQATFTVLRLREITGLENDTLNKYARAAGVDTPKRGGRNHTYSTDEVRRILTNIVETCTTNSTRDRCCEALEALD
jgi:hypothetical protein